MPRDDDDEYDARPRSRRRDDDYDDRPSRRRDGDDRRPGRRDKDYDDRPDQPLARGNGYAATSLTFGLLSFLLFLLAGIPAVIFGIVGLKRASQNGDGRGMAVAGIACAGVTTVLWPLVFILLMPSAQRVRAAAERAKTTNDAKAIGIAVHANVDIEDALPPAYTTVDSRPKGSNPPDVPLPQRLMSWRTAVLPYLEAGWLHQKYDPSQPWNSPRNQAVSATVVKAYAADHQETNETRFRVFTGPNTLFPPGRPRMAFKDIKDGASNTILVVESAEAAPWAEPRDLELRPTGPLPPLGSPNRDGMIALMADGTVRYARKPIDERVLRSAIDPADGDAFPLDP